jgi:hypothetical protein
MYEKTEKIEKVAKSIVDNLNDMTKSTRARTKKGKDYLKDGKSGVNVKMPEVDSDVGAKLGKYIEKQVKDVKVASKKVKVDVEAE